MDETTETTTPKIIGTVLVKLTFRGTVEDMPTLAEVKSAIEADLSAGDYEVTVTHIERTDR